LYSFPNIIRRRRREEEMVRECSSQEERTVLDDFGGKVGRKETTRKTEMYMGG
jgi:hypothetical protein